jgi:hypothetical protein
MYIYAWNTLREEYITCIDEKWFDDGEKTITVLIQYLKNCVNGASFTSAFKIGKTDEQLRDIKRQVLSFIFRKDGNYKNLELLIQFSEEFFEILSIAFSDQGPSSAFEEGEYMSRRSIVEILLPIMNQSKWTRTQLSHFFIFLLRFMDMQLIPFDKPLFFEIFKHFVSRFHTILTFLDPRS